IERIGPVRALELVIAAAAGERGPAVEAGPSEEPSAAALRAGLARWALRASARSVVRSIEQARRFGIVCSIPEDPWWPDGLADLGPAAPTAMWSRGDPTRIGGLRTSVAIVGARSATGYGERVAIDFAAGLVERGIAVVSGGA